MLSWQYWVPTEEEEQMLDEVGQEVYEEMMAEGKWPPAIPKPLDLPPIVDPLADLPAPLADVLRAPTDVPDLPDVPVVQAESE
jgi:hypothetical protein